MTLIGVFAGLCIFISCLGLFGLTAFTIEQRTKEIGIRKTLGASGWQILRLLFKNVFVIVAIAAVVASILSYGIMREWLQGFYYRDNINITAFVLAALASFVIAFLTMSTQSYKTAQANPVKALRHE
jgi:putative ABC transport system permease protein